MKLTTAICAAALALLAGMASVVQSCPRLDVRVKAPRVVRNNKLHIVTVTVKNLGTTAASSVDLAMTLPDGVLYKSQSTSKTSATFAASGQDLTWAGVSLPRKGTSLRARLKVNVTNCADGQLPFAATTSVTDCPDTAATPSFATVKHKKGWVACPVPSFQYYRFETTELRSPTNAVQFSELRLMLNGEHVDYSGAVATNPCGYNPSNEEPPNAIDNDVETKMLDFNKGSLVIDFGTQRACNSYTWATANDFEDRDPIGWIFYGSNDAINWVQLSVVTNYDTTMSRFTYLPSFGVDPSGPTVVWDISLLVCPPPDDDDDDDDDDDY